MPSAFDTLLENTKAVALEAREERRQASAEWDEHAESIAAAFELEDAEIQASREAEDMTLARKLGLETAAEADAVARERQKQEDEDAALAEKLEKLDVFKIPLTVDRPVGGQSDDSESSDAQASDDDASGQDTPAAAAPKPDDGHEVVCIEKSPASKQVGVVLEEERGTIFKRSARKKVFIADLIPGSPAEAHLAKHLGHQLISINDIQPTNANEAAKLIASSMSNRVTLRLAAV